jgi:uncharacterized protein YbaP (TraB family)
MMRLIGLLLALLLAPLLAGCGTAEGDWPPPSPALWRVTAPSGEQGWLFGTVHALPDGVEWRTPALEQAIDGSGLLVVEIADAGDPAVATLFRRLATTPGQPPLSERVAPGERAALAALAERAGMDDDDFAATESWGAALLLAGAVRAGDPANGVDRALIAQADSVVGLETSAEQFALFDTLSPADQSALLAATAREAAASDPRGLIEAWLTGDLARIEALSEVGLLEHPALRERLLTARNRAWAERVAGIVAQGRRPLVAVGAAHVLGTDGLPALLEARGFAVERLP